MTDKQKLKLAIEALEYVSMPITTAKENLTVDRLLATIAEDHSRIFEILKKIRPYGRSPGETALALLDALKTK